MSTSAQTNTEPAAGALSCAARRVRAAFWRRSRSGGARELAAQLRIAGPLMLARLRQHGFRFGKNAPLARDRSLAPLTAKA